MLCAQRQAAGAGRPCQRRTGHPAGTYLAACTAYAALYRKSPVGLDYTTGLDAELATLLQAAAWETSQDYFKP